MYQEPADADSVLPTKEWVLLLRTPQDVVMSRARLVGSAQSHSTALEFRLPEPRTGGRTHRILYLEPEFLAGTWANACGLAEHE